MKRMTAVGFALAMALLGPAMPGTALAQDRNAFLNGNQMAQMDYDRGDRWDRGDRGERWRDPSDVAGINIEGRWIIRRGRESDTHPLWGTNLRATALPNRMVIDQRRNVIRVEDFKGRLVQQIVIRNQDRDRGADRDGTILGQWRDSRLVTVRSGFRDTRITQTFSLTNRGRTLLVHTRQDGRGTRRDVEFTSVYQRV